MLDLGRMHEREHYARILLAFAAFLAPWEEAVAGVLPALRPWLRDRSRQPFLRADLRRLGLPTPDHAELGLSLPGPAAAWGSLYVLEGSALGGQVITRALATSGLDAAHGAAYFHGWGSATGGMWRDFRALLAAEVTTPEEIAAACAAAAATFDALASCFESRLHERTAAA